MNVQNCLQKIKKKFLNIQSKTKLRGAHDLFTLFFFEIKENKEHQFIINNKRKSWETGFVYFFFKG